MSEPVQPPTRRQALVARGEQAVLAILALVLVAGVAWRIARRWGGDEIEPVPPPEGPGYRVDLNAADWVTLSLVPHLGERLSKEIVRVREARGGRFEAVDELVEVDGIGEKTLAKVRPYLFVRDAPSDAEAEPIEMLDRPSPD